MSAQASRTVLVLEDQYAVAFEVEDAVLDMGHDVAGPFVRLSDAIAAVESREVHFGIVDLKLDHHFSYPLIDALVERRVPDLL